jgi:hypothetical protein
MPEDTPPESLTEHYTRALRNVGMDTALQVDTALQALTEQYMQTPDPPDPVPARRCPQCGYSFPQTTEYFYQRPGNGAWEYCAGPATEDCHARYWARRRSGRRAGPAGVQRIGFEIEFVGDRSRVMLQGVTRGLAINTREYTHDVVPYWKVVTDASVVDGGELVSPPMTREEAEQQIPVLCDALRDAEATVASRCGLHVHLEVRGFRAKQLRRVWHAWYVNQDLINDYVSASRRNGQWCRNVTQSDIDHLSRAPGSTNREISRGLAGLERYSALNGQAYGRYGTVEVRLHQGTLNAKKILAWHAFCRALVDWAAASTDEVVSTAHPHHDALLEAIAPHGLDDETREYLNGRREEIAREDARLAQEERDREERCRARREEIQRDQRDQRDAHSLAVGSTATVSIDSLNNEIRRDYVTNVIMDEVRSDYMGYLLSPLTGPIPRPTGAGAFDFLGRYGG